jgi:hypothetical protein
MWISAQRYRDIPDGLRRAVMRERLIPFKRNDTMFEVQTAATATEMDLIVPAANANFRTPADPEAGWASRHPDRALLFLFVTPRDCGALEELMAA